MASPLNLLELNLRKAIEAYVTAAVAAGVAEAVLAVDAEDVAFSSVDFTATDVAAALQELYDAANP